MKLSKLLSISILLCLAFLNSACKPATTEIKTEYVIPPPHLVTDVNWPKSTVPLDQDLINEDMFSYIFALEEELKRQKKNYKLFTDWRDDAIKKAKEQEKNGQ